MSKPTIDEMIQDLGREPAQRRRRAERETWPYRVGQATVAVVIAGLGLSVLSVGMLLFAWALKACREAVG